MFFIILLIIIKFILCPISVIKFNFRERYDIEQCYWSVSIRDTINIQLVLIKVSNFRYIHRLANVSNEPIRFQHFSGTINYIVRDNISIIYEYPFKSEIIENYFQLFI